MKRVKSLFVAASIIAIVIGSIQIAGNYVDFGDAPAHRTAKTGKAVSENTAIAHKAAPQDFAANPALPLAIPTLNPAPGTGTQPPNLNEASQSAPSLLAPPAMGAPPPAASSNDITGSIPESATAHQPGAADATLPAKGQQLPLSIGSARLRSAALAGDAGAAYEVAVRYSEGRGVPVNFPEAAQWFARAARQGLAPAQFHYASMLEKGQGVKKDLALARRFYLAAAHKGHAKAMHNLAVLYAEGIDGKPDYVTAVKWFRQAALHGIGDSQYNLGVLTARGLGTDQNYVESYEWFALAAAQGDQESAHKRDEIAAHLDAKELAAARDWVKRFKVEPQPRLAITVPQPRGGWDSAASGPPTPARPKATAPRQREPHQGPHAPLSLGSFTVGNR